MIVAIIILVMLAIVGTAVFIGYRLRRPPAIDHPLWTPIGIPPPYLNDALALIRFEATRTWGQAVLSIPWGGFIEWTISSPSKPEPRFDRAECFGNGRLPIFTIRWQDRVEETELIPVFVRWIARSIPIEVNATEVYALATRLRSDMAVQFNRNSYVAAEPAPFVEAPPAVPSALPWGPP